jgi:hypothetical protein
MATPAPDIGPPCDERTIAAWEAHLEREEILLVATLDSMRGVRIAIVSADWQKLPELLGFQRRLEADSREVARDRDALREEVARHAGISASEVTLRTLTASLPPGRATVLLEGRERLARMAREAETLLHTLATLVRYSLGFHQKMLEGLTGRRSPDRYSAAGTWQGVAFGSLIQARG